MTQTLPEEVFALARFRPHIEPALVSVDALHAEGEAAPIDAAGVSARTGRRTWVFADYRPQINAALRYADESLTFEDVEQALANDYAQCWATPASVVVTQVVERRGELALHIWLAGGRLEDIELMAPTILGWGKQRGCTVATFTGRKGWLRTFLGRTGWTYDPEIAPTDHCIGMRKPL